MKASAVVDACLKGERTTKKELAARAGWSTPDLAGRMKRSLFSAEDWRRVMAAMGYELRIVRPRADVEADLAVGPRVRKMEGKLIYDTGTSKALRCNRVSDDDLMLQALYQDQQGRRFVVSRAMWEGGVHQIAPVGPADAKTFYERSSGAGDADLLFPGQ